MQLPNVATRFSPLMDLSGGRRFTSKNPASPGWTPPRFALTLDLIFFIAWTTCPG
jgi:hypothetical protein